MAIVQGLRKGLRMVWRGLDGIRRFLHLLLLFFLFAIVIAALSPPVPDLPGKAALLIAPTGVLVEELEGDPVDRALAEAMGDPLNQTRLRDVEEALSWAAEDDSIPAVVLQLDRFVGGGLTKLQAAANAIETFKASGKPVYAMGTVYTQAAYYIAAHADEVWIQDEGVVFIEGFGIYRNYYRDAIDKLAIDWNVFQAGTYKSYAEPFVRNDMSEESEEANRALLAQLWEAWLGGVSTAREIDAEGLERALNDLPGELAASDGSFADMAVRIGLADRAATRDDFRDRMVELVGEDREETGSYQSVSLAAYLAAQRLLRGEGIGERNVAVVVAAGPVVDGDAPAGNIGGDSTSELIRQAADDETVDALVLRVDSGGGSTFASQLIFDEVEAFKETGRPVVVSMSSVAASAGYWISAAADEILAHPTTITGSIGVIGMFPTFQRSLEKLGIYSDGVGTTDLSGAFRPDRELGDEARQTLQVFIDANYRDFVNGVAEQRGLDRARVAEIAEGRVWTGRDALEFGLIDRFGDFEEAISSAAARSGLKEGEYGVKHIRRKLSPAEEFLLQLIGSRAGMLVADLHRRSAGPLRPLVDSLEELYRGLARFNDPRGVYADCFCDVLR